MDLDTYWIVQCPHPHCHNIQISRAKINQAICTKCGKPFRVQLKKHLNRVLADAKSLPEAVEKRTKLLEEQSKIEEQNIVREHIEQQKPANLFPNFYVCEVCKLKNEFDDKNLTLLSTMKTCSFCNQITVVYEIVKPKLIQPTEPQDLGVTVDERGDKRNKEGVVIED